jgi:ATP-binding cassette subfamily F protein 3
MELISPAHVDSPFHFRFLEADKNPHPLLQLEDCSVGYADRIILTDANLTLQPGDRIGLLGPNGAGKSTLIKLLAGTLQPGTGKRLTAQDLSIGYFAQHQLEQLDLHASPLLHLQRLDPEATEQSLRDFLGGFGFAGDQALASVKPFSGGEKARLVLALIVYQRPNLLLLDEPTNHLDLEMRHALGQALQEFAGAMLIVSHDRHLLRITSDRLCLVYDRRLEDFPGDLDDYPSWLMEHRRQVNSENRASGEHTATARRERKRLAAEHRRQLQPLKNRLRELERELAQQQQQRQRLEANLADNDLYVAERKEELKQRLAEKVELDRKIETNEETWLEIITQLEAAQMPETY